MLVEALVWFFATDRVKLVAYRIFDPPGKVPEKMIHGS